MAIRKLIMLCLQAYSPSHQLQVCSSPAADLVYQRRAGALLSTSLHALLYTMAPCLPVVSAVDVLKLLLRRGLHAGWVECLPIQPTVLLRMLAEF